MSHTKANHWPALWFTPTQCRAEIRGHQGNADLPNLKEVLASPKLLSVHQEPPSIKQPKNINFRPFGGPVARATWAWRLLRGSPWC